MGESTGDVTALLRRWHEGDRQALDRLIPLVHDELRRVARGYMRREGRKSSLQTTALVNEAYLRLCDQERVDWQHRRHFFAIAATMMRRVLVDHARRRQAEKRGAGATLVELDEARDGRVEAPDLDVLALDQALDRLAEMDPRQARVVELRIFAGLDVKDVAAEMELSLATVKREWSSARAWLYRQLRSS